MAQPIVTVQQQSQFVSNSKDLPRYKRHIQLQQAQELGHGTGGINGFAFSPDGQWLASSYNVIGSRGQVRLWKADRQSWFQQIQDLYQSSSGSSIHALSFSPDSQRLASGSYSAVSGGKVCLWQADWQGQFQQAQELQSGGGRIFALAFSPDSQWLASGVYSTSSGGRICLWQADRQGQFQQAQELKSGSGRICTLTFSPDSQWLVSGEHNLSSSRGRICLWQLERQGRFQQVQELEHSGSAIGIHALAFSPDGQWLASGDKDTGRGGRVCLWQADRQGQFQQAQELKHSGGVIDALAFSPDGQWLTSGDYGANCGGRICLWQADGQGRFQQAQELEHSGSGIGICALAFSPDGQRLASGEHNLSSGEGRVRLWQADRQSQPVPA